MDLEKYKNGMYNWLLENKCLNQISHFLKVEEMKNQW